MGLKQICAPYHHLSLCIGKSRAVLTEAHTHQTSISQESAEFRRAKSRGNSLSASEFVLQLQYVSVHVPLRARFFHFPPPPARLFKTSCLCKWTGGSHIWVTRLLEVIERLQNGACLILLFQKFSHMYSRQLCLLDEFIKFQKSFEILTYQKNTFPFLLMPPINTLIQGGAGDQSLAACDVANVLSVSCLHC